MPVLAMVHQNAIEHVGTYWLALGGCGSSVFAASFLSADAVSSGIGFFGAALALGLTVLTAVYAFSTVCGRHVNPAETLQVTIVGALCPLAFGRREAV